MPQSNSLSLNTYTSSQVYSESDDSNVEPTVEDIHEFSKRIGIDPLQESHLLDVAKEGLTQKLPRNWKPCFEPHKKAWYYYNTETLCSQWEHPLDAVYRAKVTQMKADIAMNRLQNFNPTFASPGSGRPSKNLPPLKVRPSLSTGGAYLPVPPLIPVPDTFGKPPQQAHTPASNVNRLFGPTTNSLLRSQLQAPSQKQPFSILSKPSTDSDANANASRAETAPTQDAEHRPGPRKLQPIQQLARKPTGGLTLSGSGASFLKSSANADTKMEDNETEESSTSADDERESQIRDQLEHSLAQLREENEQLIKKTKSELEKYRQSQYDKLKREVEQTLTDEVDKIRVENQRKLEDKRKELSMEFEKDLKSIEMGIKSMDKESVLQHKRDEFMKEVEQEIEAEMKKLKESMRDEQKKQIQQMKDYHATFIEKLKQEFAAEDEKIRKEHAASIAETIKELNRDREQLVVALRKQQEVELEELRSEFEQKKQFYQTEIRRLVHENGDAFISMSSQDLKHSTPNGDEMKVVKKSADLESKELELREVKSKYKQLEGKYCRMKQDLRELTSHTLNGAKPPRKLVLDELSTVATSADATDDDDHNHQNNDQDHSSSLHDSAISNNSTVAGHDANGEKMISINDIIAGSDIRLNKALSALENLRDQIIEIKSEQEMKLAGGGGTNKKTSTARVRPGGGKHGANVFPTHNHHDSLLVPKKAGSRIRTAVSASDLRKLDDNNNGTNKNPRQVVESARDFIKAQKHRLVLSSFNSENSSPSRSHYAHLHSTFPRLRRIDDLVAVKDGLYSDATTTTNEESSGIGTLYINPVFDLNNRSSVSATSPPQRSQVAQDIDGILISLKQLDKQMKFMWSAVGQKRVNNISVLLGDDAAIDEYQPTLLTPLIHPVPPNFTHPNLETALSKVKSYKQYLQNGSNNATPSDFQLPQSLLEKTKDLRQWLENF